MKKIPLKLLMSLLFIVLSVVGIADAAYLTYEKYTGATVACGGGFDCGTVLSSQWASLGPVPISVLGLLYYISIFVFSILHFLEIDLTTITRRVVKTLKLSQLRPVCWTMPAEFILVLSTLGFLFSLALVFLMAFVIKAWCLFCLLSAATSTLLFINSYLYYFIFIYKKSVFIKSQLYLKLDFFYRFLLKPVFFLFDPEFIHNIMVSTGKLLSRFSFLSNFLEKVIAFNDSSLKSTKNSINFPNPVGLAAGFDYNGDLTDILPAVGFGFHTIGTVTLHAYEGNLPPRLVRLPKSKSILVNKGLKNIGAKKIIEKLEKKDFKIPVGISIAATNKDFSSTKEQISDILDCFQLFEKSSIKHQYYELNISCPNTFCAEPFTTPKRLHLLLSALDKINIKRPVYIKMPIELDDEKAVELLSVISKFEMCKGVVFGNLAKNRATKLLNPEEREKVEYLDGNMSGKPTFEASNHMIELTKQNFGSRFTIIGTGGIFCPEDAYKKLELGADLVQLITGMIYTGPQLIGKINHYLYRKKHVRQSSAN